MAQRSLISALPHQMNGKIKTPVKKKSKTEWHRIVAFRRLGEICGEYLSKGKQVYIEGKLQTRSWEKDGVTRYTTEILADKMQMLGSKDFNSGQRNTGGGGGGYGQSAPQEPFPEARDDDIPF